MNKPQLEGLLNGLENDYRTLRKLNDELAEKLSALDSPKSKQKYSEQYRAEEKTRLREEASSTARKLRDEVMGRAHFIDEAEAFWDIRKLLRNARFVPAAPAKPKFDGFVLSSEKQVAEISHASLVANAELAHTLRAMAARQLLELADDTEFLDVVNEAIAAGDLATLNVARGVLRTHQFSSDVAAAKVKVLFVDLADRLNLPDRNEAVELISKAKGRFRDISSTSLAVMQGRPDERAMLDDFNRGVLPSQQRGKKAGEPQPGV